MFTRSFVPALVLAVSLGTPSLAAALSFTPLGDLPGGDVSSFASDVSADGQVVVGRSSAALDFEAFRWENGVMVSLGDLPQGGNESRAQSTNADGSVIVGEGQPASGSEAFRWQGAMAPLGRLAGTFSIANGVSADGSVVVGASSASGGTEAFHWTLLGGMTSLGDFADAPFSASSANDVSADGSVVVGVGSHPGGSSQSEAAMWVNQGAAVGLGSLVGGDPRSLALGVSSDGDTVVGAASSTDSFASSGSHLEAFRWTSVLSMEGLGDLPGGDFDSAANAASADGSVIVGRGSAADGDRAFIWTEAAGMLDLNALVAGLLPANFVLLEATGISADGLTIVGNGNNSSSLNEGWIVTLDALPVPEPGTGLMLALGLVALGLRNRR